MPEFPVIPCPAKRPFTAPTRAPAITALATTAPGGRGFLSNPNHRPQGGARGGIVDWIARRPEAADVGLVPDHYKKTRGATIAAPLYEGYIL